MGSSAANVAWKLPSNSNWFLLRTNCYVFCSLSTAITKKPFSILKLSRTPYIQINHSTDSALSANNEIPSHKDLKLIRRVSEKKSNRICKQQIRKIESCRPCTTYLCKRSLRLENLLFYNNCFCSGHGLIFFQTSWIKISTGTPEAMLLTNFGVNHCKSIIGFVLANIRSRNVSKWVLSL